MPLIDVPTVHAVTDDETLSSQWFPARASAILREFGNRVAIHLRGRTTSAATLYHLARALVPAQEDAGGWVVVNDRIDVGLAAGVRGIQLRARSVGVADARRLAKGLGLGLSVHTVAGCLDAVGQDRPDWLVAGNIFATASHVGRPGSGLDLIKGLAVTAIPVIAIGGVRPEHVTELRTAGAHGIAAIRGIWHASDPVSAVQLYL
jgi:thiamine-phosphate diphosphorylase